MLPDPGELNKRVLLRQRVDLAVADYGVEPFWLREKKVWARVRQVSATTYHESVQSDNTITHYITIRFRRGITADYEVVTSGTVLRVKRLRDLNSAGRYLLMECEEIGAESPGGDMYG